MKAFFAALLIFGLLVNAFPQDPKPSPSPIPGLTVSPAVPSPAVTEDDDDVVRITTNLVQLDATVTDKSGNQISNLTADDFEITENGRAQKITNFSYVSPKTAAPPANTNSTSKNKNVVVPPPPPSAPLRPDQVHRAVALVVDDLRMSAESITATRESLRKYVNTQMQPGDLVAIIRTSAGIGSLQQFTNDRQQLLNAIGHLKLIAQAGGRAGAFSSVNLLNRLETQVAEAAGDDESSADRRQREGSISPRGQYTMRSEASRAEGINEFRDVLLTVGTLGALNFVVRGLRELPGRKAVVLFSDGIAIYGPETGGGDRNARVLTALKQLIDRASRASVVFYTIDTRGLQPTGLTAADSTHGGAIMQTPTGLAAVTGVGNINPDQTGNVFSSRSAELFEGQNGLHYLADETGGIALINTNDLNKGIRRALEEISGYYLIGYRPDETIFDPATGQRFNRWNVKVKNHPEYRVRSRSGFVGISDGPSRKANRTAAEQMLAALLSPFSASEVEVQLTSFFMNDDDKAGSCMRSVLRLNPDKLTFVERPDGQYEAALSILGATFGETGQIIDQVSRVEKVRVSADTLRRFRTEGMVGGLNVPIAKPGAYLLRIAVRDDASGRIGSAGQYVEVPNVKGKDNLTLSSLVISGDVTEVATTRRQSLTDLVNSLAANSAAPPARNQQASTPTEQIFVPGGQGMMGTEDPQAGPASRRFRNKMYLNFACVIYSGKRDLKNIKVSSQVRLFYDGREVFTGREFPIDMSQQTDLRRLVVARRLFLGTILESGDYLLHLTVTDLSSGKPRTSTRWLDFRIDPSEQQAGP